MEKDEIVTLDWIRRISLSSLMKCSQQKLYFLQKEAGRELFRAQLTKDWVDTAIRFKALEEELHD